MDHRIDEVEAERPDQQQVVAAIREARPPGHRRPLEEIFGKHNRVAWQRRDERYRAGVCINGPMPGRKPHRDAIEHGPVVGETGKCQHCIDVAKKSRKRSDATWGQVKRKIAEVIEFVQRETEG